ncbi:hypothetical protein HGI16_12215 [Brevibacterium casei]|uniref:hypothetical protein n=1 Tax=Brevibacterium casei TaxID=33889 RepID=UPI00186B9DD7|nr:hypothetical protein [Brevibacterium casei]MBE4695463.1 hypothetical protein [Brevibacterium casei]MBY3578585.1 hypothetical protein [Brevibacterium casei]
MSDEMEMSAVEKRLRQSWAGRTTIRVYENIEAERKRQGISAATLSNRCKELGHPIARAVIAKMDSKDRANISIPELMVIAEALGLAPLDLIYPPYVAGVEVERLPNVSVIEEVARDRFVRYSRAGSKFPAADTSGARTLLDNWQRNVSESEKLIQQITDPDGDAEYRSYLEKRLTMFLYHVKKLQATLNSHGVTPPPLPDGMAEVIDKRKAEIESMGAKIQEKMNGSYYAVINPDEL